MLISYYVSYFNVKLSEEVLPSALTSSVVVPEYSPPMSRTSPSSPYHLCWEGEDGDVLLMGGRYSETTTELVSADGSTSSDSFTLEYNTW